MPSPTSGKSDGQSIIPRSLDVSISEQIWPINFKGFINNRGLFFRQIRYVDNRMIFGDRRLKDLPLMKCLSTNASGRPIVLETEPDQDDITW